VLRVRMLFWEESEDEQGDRGSFVLRNGRVDIEPVTPDAFQALSKIRDRALRIDSTGRVRIRVEEDPERWMRLLPLNYDGARVRAELEE